MNLPKVVVSNKTSADFIGDMIVAFVSLDKKDKFVCDDTIRLILKKFKDTADFKGKGEDQLLLYAPFASDKELLKAIDYYFWVWIKKVEKKKTLPSMKNCVLLAVT